MTSLSVSGVAVFGILVLALAWIFNSLVGLRNRMRAAWSDIDALLKRRAELIPNLVAAVEGYMEHEQRTLEGVVAARASAILAGGNPRSTASRTAAENVLTQRVHGLLAIVEDYPELRASETFLDLQRELAETENDIASARRYYNAVVRDYNTRRESFPNLIVARPFGFEAGEHFELSDLSEREAPDLEGRGS